MRRMFRVFRRQSSSLHCRRNCRPHEKRPGNACSLRRNGASSRPSHFRISIGMPGDAHGSDMLGGMSAPLANDVSRPAPRRRSTTVTRYPLRARYQAVATPAMPPPSTAACGPSVTGDPFRRAAELRVACVKRRQGLPKDASGIRPACETARFPDDEPGLQDDTPRGSVGVLGSFNERRRRPPAHLVTRHRRHVCEDPGRSRSPGATLRSPVVFDVPTSAVLGATPGHAATRCRFTTSSTSAAAAGM